ncbi:MAG: hypothetical protein M3387_05675, partial [Actinomycetota bacterium]|nr:hypothetical protein [Actinomycetota bacterium]
SQGDEAMSRSRIAALKTAATTPWATSTVAGGLGSLAPSDEAVALAVITALDAGRDPAADPAVQAAVTGRALAHAAATSKVPEILYDQLREVCRTYSDDVIATWRKPFDGAAAVLAAVHKELGAVDLDDTGSIIRRGAAAAESWGKAQASLATLTSLRTGWVALDTFTTGRTPTRRHAMFTIASIDPDTWARLSLYDQKPDPWFATVNGLRLSMPTPAEFTQRVTRLDQAVQAAAQREAAAARDRMAGRRPVSALS